MANLYDGVVLKSWDDTVNWYSRGRNLDRGRKFSSWGRVKFTDGAFVLSVSNFPVCKITSDNMLTFLVDSVTSKPIYNTLSMALHRAVPFFWIRVGMRRYRVGSVKCMGFKEAEKEGPEVFIGLQFDLTTGWPINAKADLIERVDTDARRVWLRQLRKFKHGIKVRCKIGVLESIGIELQRTEKFTMRHPDWDSDEWQNMLYEAIRDEKFPNELLSGFVLSSAGYGWGQHTPPTSVRTLEVVGNILNRTSVRLRTKFGVFTEDQQHDQDRQDSQAAG